MRQTTAKSDNVFDFNALLHPGTVFDHPRDVVSDTSLSLGEKRAILASWASDAVAVVSCPSLRASEGFNEPVSIDEIFDALFSLDGGPRGPSGNGRPPGGKPYRLRSVARTLAA